MQAGNIQKDSPWISTGEINFKDFDHIAQKSPYVRLVSNPDLNEVWKLLTEHWDLKWPKFLISVTGGSKYFDVKPEMKRILKKAVCHAATSTGAWIITGGTRTGIMKMVGEAVHEYAMGHCFPDEKIVTLGITTWGIVSNRSALESKGNGQFPTTYDIEAVQDAEGAPLDHNHSHFLLVDDGTQNIYGREIKFRKDLERYISENVKTELFQNQSIHVPIVTLVLAGGLHTLKNVSQTVKQEIPIVVIEGTGKAADLISLGYKLSENEKCDFDKRMKDSAKKMFVWDGKKDKGKIKKCLKYLKNTLKCKNLITILKTADARKDINTINQAILTALIKAKKVDASTQLKLALEWNCCDIARNKILTKENLKKTKLDDAMMTALEKDKADFVNLFIDSGVSLKKFLTIKTLHSLYLKLYENNKDPQALFIHSLIHNLRLSSKHDEKYLLNNINELIVYLLKQQPFDFYSGENYEVPGEQELSPVENPEQHLFIWAVLFNRREMAALFWQRGKDQLGAGLIASALLTSLSEHSQTQEMYQNLEFNAELFERYSTELLSECYRRNTNLSHQLLVRELPSWGNLTLFNIADTYSMMDFMEHSSCEEKLDSIWKGWMVPSTHHNMIVLCIFVPLCLTLVKFTSNDITIKKLISSNKIGDNCKSQKTENEEYKVTVFHRKNTINVLAAWIYFFNAPIVKLLINMMSYMIFIMIFSILLMRFLQPDILTYVELIALIWCATMIFEEIRQVLVRNEHSFKHKFKNWFRNMWNKFDLAIYIMMIICVSLRFSPLDISLVRRVYSVTFIVFCFRFMQFFFWDRIIGPKVIMIYLMIIDMLFLFRILLVFVFSFGVAYHSNMYPNSPFTLGTLKNVFLIPYLQMFGETSIERVEGEETPGCTRNQSIWQEAPDLRCPEADGLNILLLSVYMLLTNILLVNLIIAMFSHTFKTIQKKSRKVWLQYHLALVLEYHDRPFFAPPFIILSHLFQIIRWMLSNRCNKSNSDNTVEDTECLNEFQKVATNHLMSHNILVQSQKFDMSGRKIEERSASDETEALSNDINEIKNMLQIND